MVNPRSKLLELLGDAGPPGAGDLLGGDPSPVGTDALGTAELEGQQQAPPPAVAAPEEEMPPGIEAILGGPEMSPEERERLQMELAMAAKQRLAGMI